MKRKRREDDAHEHQHVGLRVGVGDFVEIEQRGGEDAQPILGLVIALDSGSKNGATVQVHRLYKAQDTILGTYGSEEGSKSVAMPKADLHPRRLFLCTPDENEEHKLDGICISSIKRKVQVQYVLPGQPPPTQGYWFDQCYGVEFYSFQDCHRVPGVQAILSAAMGGSSSGPSAHAGGGAPAAAAARGSRQQAPKQQPRGRKQRPDKRARQAGRRRASGCEDPSTPTDGQQLASRSPVPGTHQPGSGSPHHAAAPCTAAPASSDDGACVDLTAGGESDEEAKPACTRVLRVMELCSGCGGLSFLEQLPGPHDRPPGAEVRCTWAVDNDPHAAASYKLNNPDVHVCQQGLDEYYMLCRKWKALYDRFQQHADPGAGAGAQHQEAAAEAAAGHSGRRQQQGALPGGLAAAVAQHEVEMVILDSDDSSCGRARVAGRTCVSGGANGEQNAVVTAAAGAGVNDGQGSSSTSLYVSADEGGSQMEVEGTPNGAQTTDVSIEQRIAGDRAEAEELGANCLLQQAVADGPGRVACRSTPTQPSQEETRQPAGTPASSRRTQPVAVAAGVTPVRLTRQALLALETMQQQQQQQQQQLQQWQQQLQEGAAGAASHVITISSSGSSCDAGECDKPRSVSGVCSAAPPGRGSDEADSEVEYTVEAILDMRLKVDYSCKKVDKRGRLAEDLLDDDCQLEFLIKWAPNPSGEPWPDGDSSWQLEEDLSCDYLLAEFVAAYRQKGQVPLPEDGPDMVIVGGPPCQDMTGNNFQAHKWKGLWGSARNRLLHTFFRIVEWFRPAYTLTEQVVDSCRREQGLYIRYLLAQLVALRFQTRVAIKEAGGHGIPQGRFRLLVWSARQGEQLPAIPAHSHQIRHFNTHVFQAMHAAYIYKEQLPHGHELEPMHLTRDMLGDLPDVSNFGLCTEQAYKGPPQNALQLYLRRPPPPGGPSLAQRMAWADAWACRPELQLAQSLLKLEEEHGQAGLLELGKAFSTQRIPNFPDWLEEREGSGGLGGGSRGTAQDSVQGAAEEPVQVGHDQAAVAASPQVSQQQQQQQQQEEGQAAMPGTPPAARQQAGAAGQVPASAEARLTRSAAAAARLGLKARTGGEVPAQNAEHGGSVSMGCSGCIRGSGGMGASGGSVCSSREGDEDYLAPAHHTTSEEDEPLGEPEGLEDGEGGCGSEEADGCTEEEEEEEEAREAGLQFDHAGALRAALLSLSRPKRKENLELLADRQRGWRLELGKMLCDQARLAVQQQQQQQQGEGQQQQPGHQEGCRRQGRQQAAQEGMQHEDGQQPGQLQGLHGQQQQLQQQREQEQAGRQQPGLQETRQQRHGPHQTVRQQQQLLLVGNQQGMLRDHLPFMHNGCNYLRMRMVPQYQQDITPDSPDPVGKRHDFRELPGVRESQKGKACVGHFHHKDCNRKCGAETAWLRSGAAVVLPSFLGSFGRKALGRLNPDRIQGTVFGDIGILERVHPDQDRIMSIVESKRAQGFPDYFTLTTVFQPIPEDAGHFLSLPKVPPPPPPSEQQEAEQPAAWPQEFHDGCTPSPLPGHLHMQQAAEPQAGPSGVVLPEGDGNEALGAAVARIRKLRLLCDRRRKAMYQMIGNAVAPPLARALGRCLSLAGAGLSPMGCPVLGQQAVDPLWQTSHKVAEARHLLCGFDMLTAVGRQPPCAGEGNVSRRGHLGRQAKTSEEDWDSDKQDSSDEDEDEDVVGEEEGLEGDMEEDGKEEG